MLTRPVHVVAILLVVLNGLVAAAQTLPTPSSNVSDPQAITLAQKAVVALTGGLPVGDVTLNASVISIYGSDNKSGTGVFQAKGANFSRTDFKFDSDSRSDVRAGGSGAWQKNDKAASEYAGHNCLTDSAWFFPALTSLIKAGDPNFVFQYVGQELHGSVTTQHIRVFQIMSQDPAGRLQRLTTVDFYLDSYSSLPIAIAFKTHPDNDMNVDILAEVRFADYRASNGVLVPFRFQKTLNGSVVLDATVTGVALNAGLSDTLFNLQ